MKIFICLILFFVLSSFMQVEPVKVNLWHIIWAFVIPIIAGLYEVIVRLIPTVANYSWIQKVIEILLWISSKLNNKKSK